MTGVCHSASPLCLRHVPLGGESGEGDAVGGRRGGSPLCLRHLPPPSGGRGENGDYAQVSSGGRVETAVRRLASAPGAPLCLRHLPPRSTLSAQRNPIRIPIPLTTQCGQRGGEGKWGLRAGLLRGESGDGGAVGGKRGGSPRCRVPAQGQAAASPPAEHIECSTESDPDPDSADHSMWSAGGRGETGTTRRSPRGGVERVVREGGDAWL